MDERQPRPGHPVRLRRRVAAVALVAVAVLGSGIVLERTIGPRSAEAGATLGPVTGAWFCPHGGAPGWRGWVVIANPGPATVGVRITRLGREGPGEISSFSLQPHGQVYRSVDATDPADATTIEYFGGWVGAGAVLRSRESPTGVAAESCQPVSRRTWYLLDEPTGEGQTSYVVVMNPFDEAAEFDVTIRTEKRTIKLSALTPYVLPAHHSVALNLGEIALAGAGEETVTAQLDQRLGRVVAGGLSISDAGIRIETGISAARSRMVAPSAGDSGQREVLLLNPNEVRADLSVISQGLTSQKVVSDPDGLSVPGESVRTIAVDALKDSGIVVEATNRTPVVAAVRLTGVGGDSALVTSTADADDRWLVLPTCPPSGGRAFLVLENPGRREVTVRVELIGPDGPVAAEAFSAVVVPPGRTIRVALADAVGTRPLSALVTADGTIVAAGASYSAGMRAYAATLALPMKN